MVIFIYTAKKKIKNETLQRVCQFAVKDLTMEAIVGGLNQGELNESSRLSLSLVTLRVMCNKNKHCRKIRDFLPKIVQWFQLMD